MNILVVDCDPSTTQTLQTLLIDRGHTIDCAIAVDLSLQMITQTRYDLIVVDVGQRGLDGIGCCRQVRSRDKTLPILAITRRRRGQDKTMIALAAGATDCIAYPFNPDEFLWRVSKLHQPPTSTVLEPLRSLPEPAQPLSDRHHIEQRSREFVALAENSADFIGMCDMTLVPFYVNPAGKQLVGLDDLQQFQETPVQEFFFPEDQDFIVQDFFPQVMRDGHAKVEIRFRHFKTGAAIWMIYNVMCIRDEDGSPIALATISQNISDRKRLETEQQQTQAALQRSEELLRLGLELNAIGMWEWQITTGTSTWTDQNYRLLGYEPGEVEASYQVWRSHVHPDDIAQVEAQLTEALTHCTDFEAELRMIRQDGSMGWELARGRVICDQTGQPVRMIGISMDISDRKQAEAAIAADLRDTQLLQHLGTRLMTATDIQVIYDEIVDAAIALMHADMGSLQILDRSHNELYLQSYRGFHPDAAAFWQHVNIDDGSVCSTALAQGERVIVPDVETCDFLAGTATLRFHRLCGIKAVQSTPLISRSGQVIGMLSTYWHEPHQLSDRELRFLDLLARQAADLIEQRQTEIALRHNHEMFSALVRNAPFGIYLIDAEFRLQQINKGAEAVFSSINPLIGRDFGEILRIIWQEPFATEAINHFRHTLASGESYYSPVIVEPRANIDEIQAYDWQIHRITFPDGHYGVVCYFYDLSEIKRTEAALYESEQLLRLAMVGAQAGSWDWVLATGKLTWSPEIYRLYGLDPTAPTPDYAGWCETCLHPDDRVWVNDYVNQVIAHREPDTQLEFRILHPQHGVRWILSLAHLTVDQQGEPIRFSGINLDISDRKRREAHHSLLAEITADLSRLTTADEIVQTVGEKIGRYLDVTTCLLVAIDDANDRATVQYSWCRADTLAFTGTHRLSDFISATGRQAARLGESLVICDTQSDDRVNGAVYAEFGIYAHICVPFYDHGEWSYSFTVNAATPRAWQDDEIELIRELTHRLFPRLDRACAEVALRDNEAMLRLALGSARAGIWNLDLATGQFTVSPETMELYGLDPASDPPSYDTWHTHLLHPDDRDRVDAYYQQIIAQRQFHIHLEFRFLHPQLGTRWMQTIGELLCDPQGEPVQLRGINLDISDRKQIEITLRQREAFLDSIYHGAAQVIFVVEVTETNDFRYLDFNRTGAQLSGKPTLDLSGKTPEEAYGQEMGARFRQNYERCLQLGTSIHYEEYVSLDHRSFWVLTTLSPLRDDRGRIYRIVGTAMDISDRKYAEQELRASQAKFAALVTNMPGMVYRYFPATADTPQRFTFVSDYCAELLEVTPEAVIQDATAFINLIHPADVASFASSVTHVVEHWLPWHWEGRIITPSGQLKWIQGTSQAQSTPDGDAWDGLLIDISNRKLAEQKIQEQAALLDITADAIFVRDLDNRILYWNRGAERLYGWSAAEAIGQVAHDLLQDQISPIAEMLRRLEHSGVWQGEVRNTTKAGQSVIVAAQWTLIRDDAGRPKAILAVDTDITEKKQLEAQFYRSQRLESLGTLASGIAHDLNNVFTPILAVATLLKMQPQINASIQEMVTLLESSARRGAAMIQQILAFARGTEGERVPVVVQPLVQEVVSLVRRSLPRSIHIQVSAAPAAGVAVSADPTQLHQVLMNLCVNARDALPDGGMITLSVDLCHLDHPLIDSVLESQAGDYVVITIADTGVGIPPEVRDRIFDPFFTTKPMGQGTGLGLATVLGIVKNYGGFLQVLSQLGQGTQIKVYLPILQPQVSLTEAIAEPSIATTVPLVLIVDDDEGVRRTTDTLLRSCHYATLLAADGATAIALYEQHQAAIRAVIVDINMPTMDGITLIKRLKQMNPQVNMIAISGLPTNQAVALAAGATVFLAKPYTLDTLLAGLERLPLIAPPTEADQGP